MLTCKSLFKLAYSGESLIDPSSCWFHPKFPPGLLETTWEKEFHLVKRMIRSSREETSFTHSQTLNG